MYFSSIYKIAALLLITYATSYGLVHSVPQLPILEESIRMLYVHVPMWFGMIFLYTLSLIYALRYMRSGRQSDDIYSYCCVKVGFFYGIMGLITGMLWAKYTWGEPWSGDPKQNASAISMLLYAAYFVLRKSISEARRASRAAALYNLIGYATMIPLIFVLPRLTDSLHPGSGGNPGFNTYDLNYAMRWVFYPAVLGWILLGVWLVEITKRVHIVYRTKYV